MCQLVSSQSMIISMSNKSNDIVQRCIASIMPTFETQKCNYMYASFYLSNSYRNTPGFF